MDITVAICTWNRAGLLDQTLAEMRKLVVPPGIGWELLVVNNNCTDDTDSVIARHSPGLPLRRAFETKQGHSNARNRAVAEARGDLILWTDDDVLVAPNWLGEYAKAARAWPGAAYFGGPIEPWFAHEPSWWMRRDYPKLRYMWAVRQYDDAVRPFGPGEEPFGANLAFRRDVLAEFPFDVRLGRVADSLVGGDEVDLIERIRGAGHFGVWVGTAPVRHYIPPHRLTRRYFWSFQYNLGKWHVRTKGVPEGVQWRGIPRWLVREYLRFRLKALCLSPYPGRHWLDSFLRAAYIRGMIDEARATTSVPAPVTSGH